VAVRSALKSFAKGNGGGRIRRGKKGGKERTEFSQEKGYEVRKGN
jgi:hypothetical protein